MLQQQLSAPENQTAALESKVRSQMSLAQGLQELLGAATTVLNRAQAPTWRTLVDQKVLVVPQVYSDRGRLLRVGQES